MLLINTLGIAMMAFIVWWFWLSKPKGNPGPQPPRKSDLDEESSSEHP